MKKAVRNSLLYIISYSGAAWLYRRFCQRRGPLVRVLCFHDVDDRVWFESVMQLLTTGYNLLSVADFEQQNFHPEKINLLLTFDDGYQSWIDIVLPVLQQYNATGVFFISSGLLDAAEQGGEAAARFVRDRLLLTRPRQLLTWAGATQLVAAGQTIGGHSVNHLSLGQITDTEQVSYEITADKKTLEEKLSVSLTHFAYPFGRTNDIPTSAPTITTALKYQYIYSAETGFVSDQTKILPRTLIREGKSLTLTRLYIEGTYDIFKTLWCTN